MFSLSVSDFSFSMAAVSVSKRSRDIWVFSHGSVSFREGLPISFPALEWNVEISPSPHSRPQTLPYAYYDPSRLWQKTTPRRKIGSLSAYLLQGDGSPASHLIPLEGL